MDLNNKNLCIKDLSIISAQIFTEKMEEKNYSIEEIISEASKNNSSSALNSIKDAFELAKKTSTEQRLPHLLNSAMILAQQELDEISICTALLQNSLNAEIEAKIIEKNFGKETIQLLEQLKKINQIINANKNNVSPEKLAKIVLAIAKDIDRKSTRLNSSHSAKSRMPSSA